MSEGTLPELPKLPERPADGHKGTFGTVCVLGGQISTPHVMVGGPAFSATAALRVGAGLAVLAMPQPILAAGLTVAPSATGLALPVDDHGDLKPSETAGVLDRKLRGCRCLAIGPGLGTVPAVQQIVIRLVSDDTRPLVVDADALNALALVRDFHREFRASAILTPHPGEYARVAAALGIDGDASSPEGRTDAAETLARRLGCVVVLKGAGTVVTDGQQTYVNATGNPALATAGTGDVLTGIVAGLVAQLDGRASLLDCARLGVHVHGLAADRWATRHGTTGMLAADLIDELPDTLQGLRTHA